MVVHLENTAATDRAVVSPHRLDLLADLTITAPKLLQLLRGLATIHQKAFHLGVYTLEPFVVVGE